MYDKKKVSTEPGYLLRNIMIPFMAETERNMKFLYTIQHFECDYIFLLLFNDKGWIGKHTNLSLFSPPSFGVGVEWHIRLVLCAPKCDINIIYNETINWIRAALCSSGPFAVARPAFYLSHFYLPKQFLIFK